MKCDLILPVWNQLEYNRECLTSLFKTIDVPSRLIVIDNGSTDGTGDFLKGLTPPALVKLEIVTNTTNLGYGAGVNQGLKMTDAPFVCILNNDTIFGPGWLSTMIDLVYRDNRIGIVNPESSTFGLRPAKGQTVAQVVEGLAQRKRDFEELGNCIGFCMLIKRDVLRQIGFFDETFTTAFFDDTDFCMRAKKVGFLCVKACGAYVLHHEHKTIDTLPDKDKLFAENRLRYEQKWGRILRIYFPYIYKGKELLRNTLYDLYFLARNECYIDFVLYRCGTEQIRDIYRFAGMRPHANIKAHASKGTHIFLPSLFHILKKRKKPYNVLLFNDLDISHTFSRTHWLHRLPIYMERAGVDDLGKCFHDCHVHIVDNFQKLVGKKKV